MNVVKLKPQGFCHGVSRALSLVNKAINDPLVQKPIYILGLIVHNEYIKDYFSEHGVISLDNSNKTRLQLIDDITCGTVIITAHGVSPLVYQKLASRKLVYIDATCLDVKKVHNKIIKQLILNQTVFYIGVRNHPETEGVQGLSDAIVLIENLHDIKHLNPSDKEVYVTNQTTLSLIDLMKLVEQLRLKFPNLQFEQDICLATTQRQNAVIHQVGMDLCYVIGSKLSSNANKLCYVGNNYANVRTILIQSVIDIQVVDLIGIKNVSITSAASTPKNLTNEVYEFLKQFDYYNKKTWINFSKLSNLDIL